MAFSPASECNFSTMPVNACQREHLFPRLVISAFDGRESLTQSRGSVAGFSESELLALFGNVSDAQT